MGETPGSGVMTNVAVWYPAPPAFDKARDANIFTRLETQHSNYQLKEALRATPQVEQTFCLSVNNVLLIFSATSEEHTAHVRTVLEMLHENSMRVNISECSFNVDKSTDAGIRLEQVGDRKVYMVINERVPNGP